MPGEATNLRRTARRRPWTRAWAALVCAAVLFLPAAIQAKEKQPKAIKVEGVVKALDPNRLAILSKNGTELTLQCREDFTDKVVAGSKVTAWYHIQDGANVLQSLDYPFEVSFAPPGQYLGRIHKIIILPSSAVDGGEALLDAMANFLTSKLGWYIAPRMLAEEIRARAASSTSTLEVIDPATGEADIERYLHAHQSLIRRLAEETRVDAVLEVNIELVQANFRKQMAKWDGVQEPMAGKGSRLMSSLSLIPTGGHVPAATFVGKLWDSEANLLWRNRRGFAVLALQVGVGNKFRARSLAEALQNEARVQDWFSTVFASWLAVGQDSASPPVARQ